MRILHTSDWHLGRSFGPISLAPQQEQFVDWLITVVADQHIDLVVIAGDLYDRAIPPAESVIMMRDALLRLRALGVIVVAIAGNHDGPERVSAYDGLIDAAGVYLRGGYSRAGDVLTLAFGDGPIDIVAVPYLDPVLAPTVDGDTDADADCGHGSVRRTHQGVLDAALSTARRQLSCSRSIVVAHAFVAGAQSSESERFLTVGGAGHVGAATFDGFSYVALGHLHKAQKVGGPTRRYSGTPLPYSFSETHAKQVVIVDMDAHGACVVNEIEVPVGRAVATILGPIDALLGLADHEVAQDRFVRAIITDTSHVVDAKARLRVRFPHIIEVLLAPAYVPGDGVDRITVSARASLSPMAAAEAFWNDLTAAAPNTLERGLLERYLSRAPGDAAATS